MDVATGGLTPFTFDLPTDRFAVWSPDSARIVYSRSLSDLFEKAVNGTAERRLPGVHGIPTDWSRDGHSILIRSNDRDLWALIDGKPVRITETDFSESQGQFSPDGNWIAFASDESKRSEIYVQAFPKAGGQKFPISVAGGIEPRWRSDGTELFYLTPDGNLMSVAVKTAGNFERSAPKLSAPRLLFTPGSAVGFDYIVDKDGQRFLIRTAAKGIKANPVTVLTNWREMAKK
jgi:dipeptidyl aminopeptidase/acylaminoacyl peptidase